MLASLARCCAGSGRWKLELELELSGSVVRIITSAEKAHDARLAMRRLSAAFSFRVHQSVALRHSRLALALTPVAEILVKTDVQYAPILWNV